MTDNLPPLGAIPDPPEVMARLERRVLPRILFLPEELPESVDLSWGLPPVGRQTGSSCVGWAVGYYHKTYDECRELGWDSSSTNHQFSAHYLYNQINNGKDNGSFPGGAYGVLDRQGCCSLMNFPTNDYLVQPTDNHIEYAKPYRIYTYGGSSNADFHSWREILANSQMLTFTVPWARDCDVPSDPDYIIYDPIAGYRGYHQVCVCGYDQDINGTGVSGFRFVNSHGTDYADNGFAWISEEFVNRTNQQRIAHYWMTDYTTPPSNLRVSDSYLVWDCPDWYVDGITYEIYDENLNVIDSTTDCTYGPVDVGTYGVGALGSECLETTVVEDCALTKCMFEVI